MKNHNELLFRKIQLIEVIGFLLGIMLVWLNEVIDIPYLLLNAPQTPKNYEEALIESTFLFVLCIVVLIITKLLLNKIKFLSGFLRVCASCKHIYHEGKWIPIEEYLSKKSEAEFTHGICPECMEKMELDLQK